MSEGTASFDRIDNDFLLDKNSSQAGTCRPRSCFIQSNEIERGRYFELNFKLPESFKQSPQPA